MNLPPKYRRTTHNTAPGAGGGRLRLRTLALGLAAVVGLGTALTPTGTAQARTAPVGTAPVGTVPAASPAPEAAPAGAAGTNAAGTNAAGTTPAATDTSPAAPVPASFSTAPAEAAATRLLGKVGAARFVFVAEQPAEPGADSYRVAAHRGRILIGGNSPAVLLRGLHAYLTQVAKVDITWNGDSLGANPRLPLPAREITGSANVQHRYIYNDTDDGYTGAYRGWEQWQHTIDVLALHGINEVFVPIGTEAVYLDTFTKFGYSKQELLSWIPQAAHQPWWLLQNMSSFPSAMSERVLNQRAALGKQIVQRLGELGMKPVLPGYFGTVPDNFTARNSGAKTVPQGTWCGVKRPDWLDPTNPVFAAVAKEFYAASAARLGTAGLYKMDLLHEGGRAGDVNVGDASKAVQASLETARPGAIWAILGWQNNPLAATLRAVDRSKMLIVDGLSDRYNNLNRETQWQGTSYAFGSIWNFGGHTTMGANIGVWNQRFWDWKNKPGSSLDGIAVMPEGSDNNPVAFEFLTELAWSAGPADLADWYPEYAERRYGKPDANAAAAWQILGSTAYDTPAGTWSESQDSLYTAQPSLTASKSASWSPSQMRYDAAAFAQALPKLLDVSPSLRRSSAYRYDLMDVSRQVLANTSRDLLPQIKKAYDSKNLAEFRRLTDRWMQGMTLLDKVTGTNAQTMLGPWLAQTRKWGATDAERRELRTDAKLLLTVWLDRTGATSGGLNDYANREWAGLISGYYAPRWRAYFDSLDAALVSGGNPQPIDWFAVGDSWARGTSDEALPTTPSGDVTRLAAQVIRFVSADARPPVVEVRADRGYLTAVEPTTVTVSVRNPNPLTDLRQLTLQPQLPAGVTAELTAPAPETVPAGTSVTASYRLSTDPQAALPPTVTVTVRAGATAAGGGTALRSSGAAELLGGGPGAGSHYLSDLPFLSSNGGYGPWERDRNNGEAAAGDGGPLVLAGVRYQKGLGTNSVADAEFYLAGQCSRFTAVVGIDDSMDKPGADGDVEFRVSADGAVAYRSGTVRAGEQPRRIDLDVTGVNVLRLDVDQVDADNWWDRADWADATVTCT